MLTQRQVDLQRQPPPPQQPPQQPLLLQVADLQVAAALPPLHSPPQRMVLRKLPSESQVLPLPDFMPGVVRKR